MRPEQALAMVVANVQQDIENKLLSGAKGVGYFVPTKQVADLIAGIFAEDGWKTQVDEDQQRGGIMLMVSYPDDTQIDPELLVKSGDTVTTETIPEVIPA